MVKQRFVDLDRSVSVREGGETGGLAGGNEFLCHPDVIGGGASQESSAVVVLGFLYCFKVGKPGLSRKGQGFSRAAPVRVSGSFGVFFPWGGEEGGPPRF